MATTSSTPQPSQQPLSPSAVAAEKQRQPISLGRESGGILVLLIFIAALMLMTNDFLTPTNLANLVRQVTVFAVLSVGELFVILTGGMDLSSGSFVGVSGGRNSFFLARRASIPVPFFVGLLIGFS